MPSIDERRAGLRTRFATWTPRTLDAWLEYCAEQFASRPLVITDDGVLSYEQVAEWSARLADGLAALGVRSGDRVGLLMANYPEFVPLKFAIARAGAIAIPFNYLYRKDELAYVLAQSGCGVLITMTGFADQNYLTMLDAVAPGWDGDGSPLLPDLRSVVTLSTDGCRRDGVLTVAGLGELGERNAGAADGVRAKPDDVGDILYTSGTTGQPKGVMVTHDAVQRTAYASALTRAFEDGRRILFSLPCYHMFGYVEGLLAAMVVGGAIIPQTTFDPVGYFAGIQRHRATDILAVPTMTTALLEHPRRSEFDLSSAFAMLSGAAPAPVWLWERVRSELGISEVTTGYGMTECGGAMTLSLPEDPLDRVANTVGRPKLAGVAGIPESGALAEYKTVDPETGTDLPPGAEGELASRGPTTMLGFWNKPEETAKALRSGGPPASKDGGTPASKGVAGGGVAGGGGWLHSGDLGIVGDDGYLRLTGRSKELYKSGGELVMPKEIEELLSAHPGISQAFAIGVPDERWGEIGCACVVRAPESTVTADEIIALCKEKLARFKVPKHVLFLDVEELPTTPTGKVQKFRLVEQAKTLLETSAQ